MTHVERCLIFKCSPHDVFAGLIDIEAIPEWIPNIKKAYLTSPPPMEVGTTFVQHTVFMGQSFQIAGKVAKYDPPAAFGYIYRPISRHIINRNIDNFHAWVERNHI